MSKIKMNVAVNRSTKELVGYTKGKNPILVIAYSMDELEKKFNAVSKKRILDKKSEKAFKKMRDEATDRLSDNDAREIKLMIQATKGIK